MRISDWSSDVCSSDLLPAVLAATVIAFVAIPLGHGLARRDRIAAGMDIFAFAAFIAPPALSGVGLVALWNRAGTGWLYGSWLIIAFGHVCPYANLGIRARSGEHTSEIPSLMRISYAVHHLKENQ